MGCKVKTRQNVRQKDYGYNNVPGSNSERKQIYLYHFNAQEKSERVSYHDGSNT